MNTPAVLRALAAQCTKANVLLDRQALHVAPGNPQAGRRAGPYRRHPHLVARQPVKKTAAEAKDEIEKGFSAVAMALGHRAGAVLPLSRRWRTRPKWSPIWANAISASSPTDLDSFDFKLHKQADMIKSVMTKLAKHGKGIILMHDFQRVTAEAMPELLNQLKAGGYKVVHLKPKGPVQTLAATTR